MGILLAHRHSLRSMFPFHWIQYRRQCVRNSFQNLLKIELQSHPYYGPYWHSSFPFFLFYASITMYYNLAEWGSSTPVFTICANYSIVSDNVPTSFFVILQSTGACHDHCARHCLDTCWTLGSWYSTGILCHTIQAHM